MIHEKCGWSRVKYISNEVRKDIHMCSNNSSTNIHMYSINPLVHRSYRGGSIRPSSWKCGGICSTRIVKGERQYDYLDGHRYEDNSKNHKISILH